jgi:predicted small lipoprotein YifL
VATFDVMMTLVSAGLHWAGGRRTSLPAASLASWSAVGGQPHADDLSAAPRMEPSEMLARFIERVAIDSADDIGTADFQNSDERTGAMNKLMLLMIAAALTACGQSQPSETVEELVANPERIKELQRNARTDRAKVGDELCNRAAEAANGASSVIAEAEIRSAARSRSPRQNRAVTSSRRNALALRRFYCLRPARNLAFSAFAAITVFDRHCHRP